MTTHDRPETSSFIHSGKSQFAFFKMTNNNNALGTKRTFRGVSCFRWTKPYDPPTGRVKEGGTVTSRAFEEFKWKINNFGNRIGKSWVTWTLLWRWLTSFVGQILSTCWFIFGNSKQSFGLVWFMTLTRRRGKSGLNISILSDYTLHAVAFFIFLPSPSVSLNNSPFSYRSAF